MRKSSWTVLTVGYAIGLSTVLSPHAAGAAGAGGDGEHRTPAAHAIAVLTTADPEIAAAAVPDDFDATVGYRPTVREGMLVNPHGSCSSPVPLPAEFDTACMAHDLGYDLLRYADRRGARVGAWARQALDRQLDERMHASCDTRPDDLTRTSCRTVAGIATSAVQANSWRQGYAAPRPEPIAAGAAALGVLALGAVLPLIRQTRTSSTAVQGVPA